MDNNKAKLRLAVYRRSGEDAQDSFFAEALQQAEKDPALRAWLTDEQTFDAQFAAALGEISAPREGRALIEGTMMRPTARRVRWWPLALAASLAVLLSLTFWWARSRSLSLPQTATLAEVAEHLTEHHLSLGLISTDLAKVRTWIAQKDGPLPESLPPGLAQLGVLGCQTWQTSRGKVSLVCFVRENKDMVHLYVFENPGDTGTLPDRRAPRIERTGGWSFALWRDGGYTYAVGAAGSGPESTATLQTLLGV